MPLKPAFAQSLVAILLSFGLTAAPALAAGPAAHDHGDAPAALSLDAGKKWPTDAPLRKGMANIRAAMDASLPAIHAGSFGAAKYGALAGKIDGEVAAMVSNCKLEPKADAQLHIIIAQLLDGAEAMKGKTRSAKRIDGTIKALGALENYGNFFDDPVWKPIAH